MRLIALFTMALPLVLWGQPEWTTVEVPVSAGDSLTADVYLPNESGIFPTILIQTPYNKDLYHFGLPLNVGWNQSDQPYAFVVLDWRGHFSNSAAFDPDIPRGQDGYDVVEWIAEQSWSDGQVGTWGPSALGQVQFETAFYQPPHLVCAVPQVCSPRSNYGFYYPGGIARQEYIEQISNLFGTGNSFYQFPEYNLVWQLAEDQSWSPELVEIPMLMTNGWYDHNIEEAFFMWNSLQENAPAAEDIKLLVGPWVHGGNGTASVGTYQQGELEYPDAEHYNRSRELQFFDHYLLGEDNGWDAVGPVEYYTLGQEGWTEAADYPPDDNESFYWFFTQDPGAETHLLSPSPGDVQAELQWTSDPENPTPTVGGMTLLNTLDQGPYDQTDAVEGRDDVLLFTSQGAASMHIAGTIRANLEIKTDSPDGDLVLRLTDVYPDGRSVLVAEAQLRLRYRNGFSANDVTFMTPGQEETVSCSFTPIDFVVQEGHEFRIVLSSTNYPRLHRNANNGGELYPDLDPDNLVDPAISTTQLITGSSHLEIPIRPGFEWGVNVEENALPALNAWVAHDQLHLHVAEPTRIQVTNCSGQRVFDYTAQFGHNQFDVADWPTGIYFLHAEAHRPKKIVIVR